MATDTSTALNYNNMVTLYKNIPLYPDYRDTVYFENVNEQINWFANQTKISFDRRMYQRVAENKLRINGYVEDFRPYNYLRIWNYRDPFNHDVPDVFYAFIINIEYINQNVFEVLYEVDVMQTYMFSYNLQRCFVDREHADSDLIGDNLLAEPIDIGDYIVQDITECSPTLSDIELVLVSVPPSWDQTTPSGHRTVIVGSARDNENGTSTGGNPGDDTGHECETQEWYAHSKGWNLLRAKDGSKGLKIAEDMLALCNNDNIGYDYTNHTPNLLQACNAQGSYDCSTIATKCDTNCSMAVGICCLYAGINNFTASNLSNFYTGNMYNVLMGTGEFNGYTDSEYTLNEDNMRVGDILVTKTQGHTVVVVDIIYN